MEIKTLYHGTDTHFEEFSTDFLATNCSIDQYGSGFYFYSKTSKTVLHGGLRIKAHVTINKSIDVKEIARTRLSYDDIESLIITCPDLEEKLTNFGEIELEGFDQVLKKAVSSYIDNDYVDCLNLVGNDFFLAKDTHLLLSKFVEITGIDCITDLSRDIYVILTKNQIEFNSITHEQDDELPIVLKLKCPHCLRSSTYWEDDELPEKDIDKDGENWICEGCNKPIKG